MLRNQLSFRLYESKKYVNISYANMLNCFIYYLNINFKTGKRTSLKIIVYIVYIEQLYCIAEF